MKTISIISTLIACIAVSACGPVYKTFYDYTPPKSAAGLNCVQECITQKGFCIQEQNQISSECEERVAWQEAMCERRRIYATPRRLDRRRGYYDYECVANCFCDVDFCDSPDIEGCEENFRNCYRACGGKVVGHTECVENCNKQQ